MKLRSAIRPLLSLLLPCFLSAGTVGSARGDETPAQTIPVTVTLQVHAGNGQPIHLKPQGTATWFGPGKVAPVSFSTETGSLSTVKLPPGRWVLEADAPGYWGAPYQLELAKTGAAVALDLWPAGMIEGGFSLGQEVKPPATLAAFFRSPAGSSTPSPAPPASKAACLVDRETWKCKVPAGVLDLRFQAPGFIPRYLWGVQVQPNGTVRPGRLELRRGSAVQGWIVTADGVPLGEGAKVSLRPRISGAVRDPGERKRLESLRFEAQVNTKGFFQVDGVPPGAYLLEARHPRYAPAVTSVRVVPGEVTEVANPPLLLDLPKLLEVFIDPPADPAGQPWSVKLQRMDRDSSVVDTLAETAATPDGSWKKPGVPTGQYLLRVSRTGGETWWTGDLKVDENPAPLYVRMDVVRVKGRVFFGKKPLSAKIDLGGRFGATRIEAQSDDKGRFEAFLPRPGDWKAYVSAEDPKVERSFPKVKIQPPPGTHVAEIELRLPDTVLRGSVVDEQNNPIPEAIVSAMSDGEVQEGQIQVRTNQEGRFEIRGMLPGPTLLEADAGEDRTSDPVTVDVQGDEDSKSWILIARAQLKISGTVVSPAGPVPGARVKAVPADMPYITARSFTSDAQGHFELRLPRKTQQILMSASAPGFSFRMLRVAVPENPAIVVSLEQTGGSLIVEKEPPLDLTDPNAPMVYLLHGGSVEPLPILMSWAIASGSPQDGSGRTIIPNLEPGPYQACLALPSEWAGLSFGIVPHDRCVSGSLPANGELRLKVPGLTKMSVK